MSSGPTSGSFRPRVLRRAAGRGPCEHEGPRHRRSRGRVEHAYADDVFVVVEQDQQLGMPAARSPARPRRRARDRMRSCGAPLERRFLTLAFRTRCATPARCRDRRSRWRRRTLPRRTGAGAGSGPSGEALHEQDRDRRDRASARSELACGAARHRGNGSGRKRPQGADHCVSASGATSIVISRWHRSFARAPRDCAPHRLVRAIEPPLPRRLPGGGGARAPLRRPIPTSDVERVGPVTRMADRPRLNGRGLSKPTASGATIAL